MRRDRGQPFDCAIASLDRSSASEPAEIAIDERRHVRVATVVLHRSYSRCSEQHFVRRADTKPGMASRWRSHVRVQTSVNAGDKRRRRLPCLGHLARESFESNRVDGQHLAALNLRVQARRRSAGVTRTVSDEDVAQLGACLPANGENILESAVTTRATRAPLRSSTAFVIQIDP
jgi:hypothetical protein